MYKGVDLPNNYNELTLAQKEAIWLGMLLVYETGCYFDRYYWEDEIVNCCEKIVYEDDLIVFAKCYNSEYLLKYKTINDGMSSSFDYFFDSDETHEFLNIGKMLGVEEYKNIYLRDYLRSKGFPVTAEFWQ